MSLLFLKAIDRPLARGAMDTHIGRLVHPLPALPSQVIEVGEVAPGRHPWVPVLGEEVKVGPATLVHTPGPPDVHTAVEAVAALLPGHISALHRPVVLRHRPKHQLGAPQPFIVHGQRISARRGSRRESTLARAGLETRRRAQDEAGAGRHNRDYAITVTTNRPTRTCPSVRWVAAARDADAASASRSAGVGPLSGS